MRLPVDGAVTCGRTTPVTGQDRPRRLPPFPSDFLEVCPPPLYSPGPPGMAMERWCLTNSIDGWHCGVPERFDFFCSITDRVKPEQSVRSYPVRSSSVFYTPNW